MNDIAALLAYLQGEPGEDVAADRLDLGTAASALTVQELVSKIVRDGGAAEEAAAIGAGPGPAVHPLTEPLAIEPGATIAVTRSQRLGRGDRARPAAARSLGVPAIAADRPWRDVPEDLGVRVELVRWAGHHGGRGGPLAPGDDRVTPGSPGARASSGGAPSGRGADIGASRVRRSRGSPPRSG